VERLQKLQAMLDNFQKGVKSHLMSQVQEERPEQAAELESKVDMLVNKIGEAAVMQLVNASSALEGMYEGLRLSDYLYLFEDTRGRLKSAVHSLDADMDEADECDDLIEDN